MSGHIEEFRTGIETIQQKLQDYELATLAAKNKHEEGLGELEDATELLNKALVAMRKAEQTLYTSAEMIVAAKNDHLVPAENVAKVLGLSTLNHSSAKTVVAGISELNRGVVHLAARYRPDFLAYYIGLVHGTSDDLEHRVGSTRNPEGHISLTPMHNEIGQIVSNSIQAAGDIEV